MEENKIITKYKNVSTKISPESYEQLKAISDKFGLNIYNMIQIVVDSFLKSFEETSTLNSNIYKVVNTFANIEIEKDKIHLCDCSINRIKKWKCSNILAIISDNIHHYSQIVAIGNKDNKLTQTTNNDTILKLFFSSFTPDILDNLEKIRKENNLISLTDSLKLAINYLAFENENSIENEIAELFSDNNRSEFGKVIDYSDYGKFVKRKSRDNRKKLGLE